MDCFIPNDSKIMISNFRPTAFFTALIGVIALSPITALAVPTIRVWDGVNAPLLIADESGGDSGFGTSGMVAITGITYNGWSLDLEYGLSKPLVGSATSPELSFYASAMSSGAGSLTIQFSDDGFGPVFGGYALSYAGETAATSSAAYKAYLDNTNMLFGGSVLASSVDSGSFNHDVQGIMASSGPFSLTHEVRFTHAGGVNVSSSISANLVSVPDGGATIALLGSTFLALGAVRRKFRL
jgi:hypothetical protein